MRLLFTLTLALLVPIHAHASPVTFEFTAGLLTGQYTFEITTPGVRQISTDPDLDPLERIGGLRYFNAITNFDIHLGPLSTSGTGGDIELAINRGRFGENWYSVDIRVGPLTRLFLSFFSASGFGILTTEALTAAEVPERTPEGGVDTFATLFNDDGFITSEDIIYESVRGVEIRRVPEPSSALLFGLGLIAAAARHRFFPPKPRKRLL